MLGFHDITLRYPKSTRPALEHVSLSLERGELVVLLGANGSGKSTLARLANAMLLPSSGQVLVDGLEMCRENLTLIRRKVAVVAQDPDVQIVSSSVLDELAFGPENLGLPREEILRRCKAAAVALGLEGMEERDPNTLSGGERQRVVIASVLAMEPDYFVFDEPCSMLDAQGCAEVRAAIERLHAAGHGILHITHDLEDCLAADRVMLLDQGHVVFEGSPDDLLDKNLDLLDGLGFLLPPMLDLRHELLEHGVEFPVRDAGHRALAAAVLRWCEREGEGVARP